MKDNIPFGWMIEGSTNVWRGEFAEIDAKFEAKRCGGTCKAFPIYTKLVIEQQSYGWLIACDEELVCTHLGVAELSHSYDYAKTKLRELIDWHIAVAIDPTVNGGFSLQKDYDF